jgi:hypothetical protein
MQGIYTYIPETNYVPREYSVAAILLFLFIIIIINPFHPGIKEYRAMRKQTGWLRKGQLRSHQISLLLYLLV